MRRQGMNFKAKKVFRNGQMDIDVEPVYEMRKYVNGRVDTIVHLPSLEMINRCKEAHGIR